MLLIESNRSLTTAAISFNKKIYLKIALDGFSSRVELIIYSTEAAWAEVTNTASAAKTLPPRANMAAQLLGSSWIIIRVFFFYLYQEI